MNPVHRTVPGIQNCILKSGSVHAHGQERKHKCDVCGAKFIQKHHFRRHMKQFHGDNATATITRVRVTRGPNTNQNDL